MTSADGRLFSAFALNADMNSLFLLLILARIAEGSVSMSFGGILFEALFGLGGLGDIPML